MALKLNLNFYLPDVSEEPYNTVISPVNFVRFVQFKLAMLTWMPLHKYWFKKIKCYSVIRF